MLQHQCKMLKLEVLVGTNTSQMQQMLSDINLENVKWNGKCCGTGMDSEACLRQS